MNRLSILVIMAFAALAACTQVEPRIGPDGRPMPQVQRISEREANRIPYEMLDSVNALRGAAGVGTVQLDSSLTAAAATHARDMSVQNRPWHFGSDGSSPLDRVQRAGYAGQMLGENISETYEGPLDTLSAWMEQPDTRNVILDRNARNMGVAFYQEPSGKIWWTMILGG